MERRTHVTTLEDKRRLSCAEWEAKLERGLAEELIDEPANYIETIEQFTASAGSDRIVIVGDNDEGNGGKEYVDVVMLDSENIAIFEYEDDPGIGTDVNVLRIVATGAWEDQLNYYANRFYDPDDVQKLKNFHVKHLKLFKKSKST
jgi:hypothetical protein